MNTVIMMQPQHTTPEELRYYQMRWERRNLRMRITIFMLGFVGTALSLIALA